MNSNDVGAQNTQPITVRSFETMQNHIVYNRNSITGIQRTGFVALGSEMAGWLARLWLSLRVQA